MTQARRTQAQRSAEMRTRLSRAAYEVIADHGHSALRTAAVAARAGVSQGALLHHFETKDAVTLAAIEYALDVAGAASRKTLARTPVTVNAVLKAMLRDFRAFFMGDRFWVALGITMDASKNAGLAPKIRSLVAARRQPIYDAWSAALVARGWNEKKAGQAVTMTAALVSGFAIRSLWASESKSKSALDQRWLDLLMSA